MNNKDDPLPVSTPKFIPTNKKDPPESNTSSRVRYKFWALSVIILLAYWSMLTGTVTLRSSSRTLHRFSDNFTGGSQLTTISTFLPEIEEREKVVEHMWDVYTNSHRIGLPHFWQRAFVAAFEDLTSDVPAVREAAVREIAKMSVWSVELHPPRRSKSMNLREFSSHGRRRRS